MESTAHHTVYTPPSTITGEEKITKSPLCSPTKTLLLLILNVYFCHTLENRKETLSPS